MGIEKAVFEQLRRLAGTETVILTIGNTLKGDDGAGPAVCQRLGKTKICAELIDAGTVPENYIQPIVRKAPHNLIIIDAVDFGGSPGDIRIFGTEQLDSAATSTHTLSPHLFIDMIRAQIEVGVCFIGVQPGQTGMGRALSGPVEEAVVRLADTLAEVLGPR